MSESLKHDYETFPILGSPAVSERDVAAVRLVFGRQNQTFYGGCLEHPQTPLGSG